MTADELITKLQEMGRQYPGRPLVIHAKEGMLAIRVASGDARWLSEDASERAISWGVGSRWEKIEIPSAVDA